MTDPIPRLNATLEGRPRGPLPRRSRDRPGRDGHGLSGRRPEAPSQRGPKGPEAGAGRRGRRRALSGRDPDHGAGNYYSYTLLTRARPYLPQGPTAPEEIVAVWDPFTANAGTFEISDDTMTRRPIVAKNPNAMGPGIFNEYAFRLSADTLWLTTVGTETGPARNPATVRYERLR